MITIRETLRNYHHKQYDLTALAEEDNAILGYCDFSLYNDTVYIEYLEVKPEYRRKGIAKQIFDWIHDEYSDKKIKYGYTTTDGNNFINAYHKKEPILAENLNQALKYLKQNNLSENDADFVKLKKALKDSIGYLGVFTNFLTQRIKVDDLINMYNEIKNNSKYISFLKKPIIEHSNYENLLDDWTNAKLAYDAKRVLNLFYKDFATKDINDAEFKSYAERFLKLSDEKQKMFLKTQKYYKENNVNIEKFYKDFYTYIDSVGKNKDEIRSEILSMRDRMKILINTEEVLLIQSNNREIIKKFGSPSWCIVYSDAYYKQYVDYNMQFLIFNFTVPQASPDSLYGVTISLNTLIPVHGGCQNKLNEDVELSVIEKNCKIEHGYLENYVTAISTNLKKEIDNNFEKFSKVFKKYKDAKELYHFVAERVKSKFHNLSLAEKEVLPFLNNFIKEAKDVNVELSDIINEKDLAKMLLFSLTLNDVVTNLQLLYWLVDAEFKLNYNIMFRDDAVFVSFMTHLSKNVSKQAYNKFIHSFFRLNTLSLEKLNAFDYENFEFAITNGFSDVVLDKSIANFPNIIKMLKEFFKKKHEYLNISIDFLLKNQKVLNLTEQEFLTSVVSIFNRTTVSDYSKDVKKIENEKGAAFALDVKKAIIYSHFNSKRKYEEKALDIEEDKVEYCKMFIDAYNLKVVNEKELITSIFLEDLIGKFCLPPKNLPKELLENFLQILEKMDIPYKTLLNSFYKYDHQAMKRMQIIQRILKTRNYNIEDNHDLKVVEEFALDIAACADLTDKFFISSKDLGKISKKLNLNYNVVEQGFEFKIPKLSILKNIVLYDEDYEITLDHKEGEKFEYFKINDYQNYLKDLSSANLKILSQKEDQNEQQKLVRDAVNIAVADELYKQLVNAVFEKMFKSGYFKKWKNGRNYQIENGKYVILITDKFIAPAISKGELLFDNSYSEKSYSVFGTCLIVMENRNEFIKLEESDFNVKYDKNHLNQIISNML